MHSTVASFVLQNDVLLIRGVNVVTLNGASRCQVRIKWTAVPVSSSVHLGDLFLVAVIEGSQFSFPTPGFRMVDVPLFSLSENVPERVQLPMLSQQVLAA